MGGTAPLAGAVHLAGVLCPSDAQLQDAQHTAPLNQVPNTAQWGTLDTQQWYMQCKGQQPLALLLPQMMSRPCSCAKLIPSQRQPRASCQQQWAVQKEDAQHLHKSSFIAC